MAEPATGECECCGFDGADVKRYRNDAARERKDPDAHKVLCDLCASTMTGSWHEYPHQHDREILELMRTVCHVGNAVISEIRKSSKGQEPK